MLRKIHLTLLCLGLAVSLGCASFRMGPGLAPTEMGYRGILNGYASAGDLPAYNGSIVSVDVLSAAQQSGEILSFELWPVGGVGLGLIGARAHVASLGAGFGTLFYDPVPLGELTIILEIEGDGVSLDSD